MYKKAIVQALRQLGIKIERNMVSSADFRRVFGATYVPPEWVTLADYKVNYPRNYIQQIEQDDLAINRINQPTSFSMTRYGEFLDENGDRVVVDGMVYQYSMRGNPRNVHYAFRLFKGGQTYAKNSELGGIDMAKTACNIEAQKLIETKLYDIS